MFLGLAEGLYRGSSSAKSKAAIKSKIAEASSSRQEDDDIEMHDADYHEEDESDFEEPTHMMGASGANEKQGRGQEGDHDDDEDDGEGDDDKMLGGPLSGNPSNAAAPPSNMPPPPSGIDEAAAMAIFGDYRQFGSYMMSLGSRLKNLLTNIKATADPTTRLLTLQELSELLSISTEDTLAGSFPVESFVKELVRILGGKGNDEGGEDDDGEEDGGEMDEDAQLAAALAMSTGGQYQGDENPEAQVLACRCLANLMEALPGVAHTVVYHGAIPVLCSKLVEISYIDLAEQTLSVSFVSSIPSSAFAELHLFIRLWRRFRKSFPAQS